MSKAEIKMYDVLAGWLTQDEFGYHFVYDTNYLNGKSAEPVSLTLHYKKLFLPVRFCFHFLMA